MDSSASERRKGCRSTVLVVAMLAFVWHVVPLPASVHNAFTATLESHVPLEGDAEASHVASCDAMTSRTVPSFGVPGVAISVSQPAPFVPCAPPRAALPLATRSSLHRSGTPLFLLHASFLI
jgi:hypothetical protein